MTKFTQRCKVDARAHQHHAASRSSLRELAIHLLALTQANGAQASRKTPSRYMQTWLSHAISAVLQSWRCARKAQPGLVSC